MSTISSRVGLAVAAAAVVAVALGATFLIRSNDQSGVGATALASPTIGSGEAPASSASIRALGNAPLEQCPGKTGSLECIKPGTYLLGSTAVWPAVVTVDVPAGWWLWEPGSGFYGLIVQDPDTPEDSGWGLNFSTVASVSVDPCSLDAGTYPADTLTAAGMVATIAAWPGFEASTPEHITNGAYEGQRVTLMSTRTSEDCGSHIMWTTKQSFPLTAYPLVNEQGAPYKIDIRIFEIDSELLVVIAMDFPETTPFELANGIAPDPDRHAADQVELAAILDSIELKGPQDRAN